jgi:hypothetical protein
MQEYKENPEGDKTNIPVQKDSLVNTALELGGKISYSKSDDAIIEQCPGGPQAVLPDGTRVDPKTGDVLLEGPSDD